MLSQAFADVTRGITVDRAAFARDMVELPAADRCYVLLFSPRSGSSWITSLLSGRLGWPHEFINPGFVRNTAISMDATTPTDLLRMLVRRRRTPNGVFGIEARFIDIHALGVDAFTASFAPRAVFFNLWRDNLVAQGISLYRANATQRFHSTSTGGSAAPPPYDAGQIGLAISQIAEAENDNVGIIRKLGVAARFLRYEDIVQDRDGTIGLFCRALGVAYDPADYEASRQDELTRISDDWNRAAEARFRADHASQIAAMESHRLVKHGVAGVSPFSRPLAPALQPVWQAGHDRAKSGADPFANPFPTRDAHSRTWLQGWRAGWDDQLYPARNKAPAALPPGLPEARDAILRDIRHPLPRPLHDYTAVRLADLLQDQNRRAIPGALVEIGMSRGRQTATLLEAARAAGIPLIGFDPGQGGLAGSLLAFLRRRLALREGEWTSAPLDLPTATPDSLASLIAGSVRFIAVDCSHAPEQVEHALALAEAVVGPDGCVAVSDFLHPPALTITEGVFRYFAQPRGLVPFAFLPGRLLLAPTAAAPRYAELILAFAVRDRENPVSARFIESLSQNGGAALNQTLFGSRIIVLS